MSDVAFGSYLADLLDPPDTFTTLGYTPSERQAEFHAATEFDVLYGGAAGGGKSVALVMEALRRAHENSGMRILLIRRTYDELNESIFPALQKFSYAEALGARWHGTDRELTFPNRALVRFRYMETLEDASRRQGGEYQLLLVDEATLLPPGVVDFIRYERLRSSGGIPVIGVRSTTNPGGISHSQVRKRYIEATNYGEHVALDDPASEHPLTVRFIPAKASDNVHLDGGYRYKLDNIPDPQRRAAMRDGSWDVFAGQVFSEWSRDRHVVETFEVGPDWQRLGGLDYGYRAPSAAVWGASDQDGRVWVYRELYESGLGEQGLADALKAYERTVWDADPAMWNKTGDALPPADVLALEGVPLRKAINDRVIGWTRLHSYLAEAPACAHHRALGWSTCPMLHVMANCEHLIRTLPALPYARRGNPEDADTTSDDHLPDALRYLVMGIGVAPSVVFPPDDAPGQALNGEELMVDAGGGIAFGGDWAKRDPGAPQRGATQTAPWA
jgi:hypothetical protein